MTSNPVDELIAIQKQNQELLKIIAENQAFMAEIQQENLRIEKNKTWWQIGKYVAFAFMIYLSFSFTQKLTQDLVGNLTGGVNPAMANPISMPSSSDKALVDDFLKSLR
jgi:hypothetical protein